MDESLADLFDATTTTTFGSITVTLGKRRAGTTADCEEVLYVTCGPRLHDAELSKYIRFHRSFVMHRHNTNWPHRTALVYDLRAFQWPDAPTATAIEQLIPFATMQSDLGDFYETLLHNVCVVLKQASSKEKLQKGLDFCATLFGGPPTKPVLPLLAGESLAKAFTTQTNSTSV